MHARRIITRIAIVLGGAGAAVIIWTLALLTGGIRTASGGAAQAMPVGQVVAVALVVGAAGWALLALLEARLHHGARKIWTVVALIVVVVSLSGPLAVPGIEFGDRLWLLGVHLALPVVYIPAMSATAGRAWHTTAPSSTGAPA